MMTDNFNISPRRNVMGAALTVRAVRVHAVYVVKVQHCAII
jgi:hypothetical protein